MFPFHLAGLQPRRGTENRAASRPGARSRRAAAPAVGGGRSGQLLTKALPPTARDAAPQTPLPAASSRAAGRAHSRAATDTASEEVPRRRAPAPPSPRRRRTHRTTAGGRNACSARREEPERRHPGRGGGASTGWTQAPAEPAAFPPAAEPREAEWNAEPSAEERGPERGAGPLCDEPSPGCRQIRWRRTAAAAAAPAAAAPAAGAGAGEEAAAAPPTVPPPRTAFESLTHTGREGKGLVGGRGTRGRGRATSGGGAEEALGGCSFPTERKKRLLWGRLRLALLRMRKGIGAGTVVMVTRSLSLKVQYCSWLNKAGLVSLVPSGSGP